MHTAEENGPCVFKLLLNNKLRFLKRIWSLARNKALGKDGVPNEILKNLPENCLGGRFAVHRLPGSTRTRINQALQDKSVDITDKLLQSAGTDREICIELCKIVHSCLGCP